MSSYITQPASNFLEVLIEERKRRGYVHEASDYWPVGEASDPFAVGQVLASRTHRSRTEVAVALDDDVFAHISVGVAAVVDARVFARSRQSAAQGLQRVRAALPASADDDPTVVPVMFWTLGRQGPRVLRREIDAPAWEEISNNYMSATQAALERLFSETFRPGAGGQMMLWEGDPGTGKTTALRALARVWRTWCDVDYVVDPEQFFGASPDYMMDVLMEGAFDDLGISEPAPSAQPRWRLLVLEDCGEMLEPDARREVGQALSRLLNLCDGLIGRGLRFLVLVTTNEPIGRLHEAVSRPGRCAAHVEFQRFDNAGAQDWLARRRAFGVLPSVSNAPTLADLYGAVRGTHESGRSERRVGF